MIISFRNMSISRRKASTRHKQIGEGFVFEVLHDEEVEPVLLAEAVENAEVGVAEATDDAGFALEALAALGVGGEMGRGGPLSRRSVPGAYRGRGRLHPFRPRRPRTGSSKAQGLCRAVTSSHVSSEEGPW